MRTGCDGWGLRPGWDNLCKQRELTAVSNKTQHMAVWLCAIASGMAVCCSWFFASGGLSRYLMVVAAG